MAGNLLFDTLTAPARRAIINSMSPMSVPPGTAMIKQGDTDATRFYVLASGRATVHVADAHTGATAQVATYGPARRGFLEAARHCSQSRRAEQHSLLRACLGSCRGYSFFSRQVKASCPWSLPVVVSGSRG